MDRRTFLTAFAAAALPPACAAFLAVRPKALESPVEIRISAKRFEYTPNVIRLKKGQPVVFVLTSQDRIHGFRVEGTDIHAVITPDETVTVPFTPERAGTIAFGCDIFCGGGHEHMNGTLVVEE